MSAISAVKNYFLAISILHNIRQHSKIDVMLIENFLMQAITIKNFITFFEGTFKTSL